MTGDEEAEGPVLHRRASDDPSDPVEHTSSVYARLPVWNVWAASVRGKLHQHEGRWRDDSFALADAGRWVVAAVADGAGSARLSRVGSKIAANASVASLIDFIRISGVAQQDFSHLDQARVCEALSRAASKAKADIDSEAVLRGCQSSMLATTLLLVAHTATTTGDYVFWFEVGDGVAAVQSADGECLVLSDGEHGEAEGETVFLTSRGIEMELAHRVKFVHFPAPLRALALMTDGVSEDFFPVKRRLQYFFSPDPIPGRITAPDGSPLRGVLGHLAPDREDESLLEWLAYEKPGSFDDRTVVLMVHRGRE